MKEPRIEKIEKISRNKKSIEDLAIPKISKSDKANNYADIQKEENEKLKHKIEREKQLKKEAEKHQKSPEELFRSMYKVKANIKLSPNVKTANATDEKDKKER